MKFCTKCGINKSVLDFSKDKSYKDGLASQCKSCWAEYYQANRIEFLIRQNGYNQLHKDEAAKQRQTPVGKEAQKRSSKNHQEKFPEKVKAIAAVNHAIRDGRLHRPPYCEDCGKERFVQGHHNDYSKYLEVKWLCLECHSKLHKKLLKLKAAQANYKHY